LFSSSLLSFIPMLSPTRLFRLMEVHKKGKKKVNYNPLFLFFLRLVSYLFDLFFFPSSYDLPPFFATFVFVFLLADASPFLLDFFLVAIIS
jgi:hypothetical protein